MNCTEAFDSIVDLTIAIIIQSIAYLLRRLLRRTTGPLTSSANFHTGTTGCGASFNKILVCFSVAVVVPAVTGLSWEGAALAASVLLELIHLAIAVVV